jgi:hypothetical protein
LEVKDLCDVEVPDERSVMTYVAEFFHKFSSEGRSSDIWMFGRTATDQQIRPRLDLGESKSSPS